MQMNKIIRTITLFTNTITDADIQRVHSLKETFQKKGFVVQTERICTRDNDFSSLHSFDDGTILLSVGTVTPKTAASSLPKIIQSKNISFHIDLTTTDITEKETEIVFELMKNKPEKLFMFTYVFNNISSSPFYPSAQYAKTGFAIGLQTPDLSVGCKSLSEWFIRMKSVWVDVLKIGNDDKDFLGIDSSIAPMGDAHGSLIRFLYELGLNFSSSITTDTYLQMTQFIKNENPKPIGLCGLMFPCLEDFLLAEEYERGNFSIERNLFLSLHSGLGIDTYPIGVDEDRKRIIQILRLVQGLSNKHAKPLSVRFVSDGVTKIGQKSNFKNPYLKDVVIRPL